MVQFSLQGFLLAVTVFAVWLGWKVERARTQHETVEAIKAAGGDVLYDWERKVADWDAAEGFVLVPLLTEIPGPPWLRQLVGDDFFQDATDVFFSDGTLPIGMDLERQIRSGLPHCRIARKPLQKGMFLTTGGSLRRIETTLPARSEALELRGFDGMTPRSVR